MSKTPILDFIERENRIPTDAEFRYICLRNGLSFENEARDLIGTLRDEGVFRPRMNATLRELLAVLARTARAKPRLVVDNTPR
ncbi:MAG TPA: hypothetical protein VGB82_05950 [Alphaproteobacteria bacterium]